jgi:hypothetical protein
MGWDMQVLRALPLEDHHPDKDSVVEEAYPGGLMLAFDALCAADADSRRISGSRFPMLAKVGRKSLAYVDEDLYLASDEVRLLVEDFRALRRVCRNNEFIAGLDGPTIYDRWRGSKEPSYFEECLDFIEAVLVRAVERGYWVRFML